MRTLLAICLIVSSLFAKGQNSVLEGFVIDDETNEPIYGIIIEHNNVIISFSDDNGRFVVQTDTLQWNDSITFRHLSYHNVTLPLKNLSNDSIVRLKSSYYELDAITIQPESQKKRINAIIKQFRRSSLQNPYWTDIHQTQSIILNGKPSGYIECTGKMFNLGLSETIPYMGNVLYPEHVRRTKEDVKYLDQQILRISEHTLLYHLYRFFDVAHPLGSYNKNFVFSVDSAFVSNNKSYLAVSFQLKKHSNYHLRDMANFNGHMWIDIETNSLEKLLGSFNFRSVFTQLEINYGKCDSYIVPQTIHLFHIHEQTVRGRRQPQKVLSENYISITAMAHSLMKKYKGEYGTIVYHPILIPGMPYEPEYWSQYPNKHGITDQQFIEGVNEQIFINELTKQKMDLFHQIDRQIKNEIKGLTWKRIE